MDRDLLSRVLGRPIAPSKLVPALFRGYRRSAVQACPIRWCCASRPRQSPGMVEFGQQPARSVLLFVPKPGAFVATGKPWSLMRWRSHTKSKVLHSAIMALLLFTCEITPGLRLAEAATVSATNPNYSAFSSRCLGDWDSDLSVDFVQLLAHASRLTDVVSCRPDLSSDPLKAANAVESGPRRN